MSSSEIRHGTHGVTPTLFGGKVTPIMPFDPTAAGHTHGNLPLLDSLNIDDKQVFNTGNNPIQPPLSRNDW